MPRQVSSLPSVQVDEHVENSELAEVEGTVLRGCIGGSISTLGDSKSRTYTGLGFPNW